MAKQTSIGVPDNNSYRVDVKLVDVSDISIVDAILGTSVIGPGYSTVIPSSMNGIAVGTSLRVDEIGSGIDEIIVVKTASVSGFNAYFQNSHNSDAPLTLEVARQKMVIADSIDFDLVAPVAQGPALSDEVGLTVRVIPQTMTVAITGIGENENTPVYTQLIQPGTPANFGPIISTGIITAGSSAILFSPLITQNKTGILKKVAVSASGSMKWELQIIPNASSSPITMEVAFTTSNFLNHKFEFNNKEIEIINADGIQAGFAIKATNTDFEFDYDAYVSFYWQETN